MIQAKLRAPDRETLETAMVAFGLLRATDDGPRSPQGLTIVWDIPIWIDPPTYDEEGNQLTAGLRDPRCHADIHVGPPATDTQHESGGSVVDYVLSRWVTEGAPGAHPNKAEASLEFYGVELIDAATVSSPAHVFL